MNDEPIIDYSKYIDPDIHNTLLINFRLRALCEVVNDKKGFEAVAERISKVLGNVAIDVKTHSVKTMASSKQRFFSGKAIAIGIVDVKDVFKFASRCIFTEKAPGGLTKSRLQITVNDSDSPTGKYSEVLDVSTVKIMYSTPTFAGDIDIIPEIASTLSKAKLIANKQKIAEVMSLKSLALAEYIELIMTNIHPKVSKIISSDLLMYASMRNKEDKVLVKARKAVEENYKDHPGINSIFNTLVEGVL